MLVNVSSVYVYIYTPLCIHIYVYIQVGMHTYIHLCNIVFTLVHPRTPYSDSTDDSASNGVGLGSNNVG